MGLPVMGLLKQSTQEQHERIERLLDLQRAGFTLSDYRRLLERFYGYYQPWEQMCAPLVNGIVPAFFDQRGKLPLLRADLEYFGVSDTGGIPVCLNVPVFDSAVAGLGSMYVIEGSTLGGRLLSRHFSESLGIGPTTGGQFFSGYGDRTGSMWREFSEVVEAHASATEAIEAARVTFDTLADWLVAPRGAA